MALKTQTLIAINIVLFSFVLGLGIGLYALYQPLGVAQEDNTITIPRFGMDGLSHTDLDNKVSVLNLFASWCLPCESEHPLLFELANTHNIPVYGIAVLDEKEATNAFIERLGDPYIAYGHDERGMMYAALKGKGVPETMIIDGFSGEIVWRFRGPITEGVIADKLLPAYNAALNTVNAKHN